MHSYVAGELIELVTAELPVAAGRQSIIGHSSSGPGALVCALRQPGLYRSVSVYAPYEESSVCELGEGAYEGDVSTWSDWEATELVRRTVGRAVDVSTINRLHLLIDQRAANRWLNGEQFDTGMILWRSKTGTDVKPTEHEDYDHGCYFVASYIRKHLDHHRRFLC